MTHSPKQPASKPKSESDKPVINFDMASSLSDIEKHLQDARRSTAHERLEPQSPEIVVDASHITPGASVIELALPTPTPFKSNFLTELAEEAAKKQDSNLSETQELRARSLSLNNALSRIDSFLASLSQFANDMLPEISRVYRLDARSAYAKLKWGESRAESRKQDLSATALITHVTFSLTYRAPEPVLVTRPWNQLEALKLELKSLSLKVLDESELDGKRPKQEWVKVHLSESLPIYLRFQANYDKGHIDVLSRNLITFGISSFRLKLEDITPSLLDEIGRVLLSRTDMVPAELTPI